MIKKFISVMSHALCPPCHKLSHLLGPPPSLERDVLYGRPLVLTVSYAYMPSIYIYIYIYIYVRVCNCLSLCMYILYLFMHVCAIVHACFYLQESMLVCVTTFRLQCSLLDINLNIKLMTGDEDFTSEEERNVQFRFRKRE